MKRYNNKEVMLRWIQGRGQAHNHRGSLRAAAFGGLWSYNLKIGQRTDSQRLVIADYTATSGEFRSQTTSTHVNLARQYADDVMHPCVWMTTPLSVDEEIPF